MHIAYLPKESHKWWFMMIDLEKLRPGDVICAKNFTIMVGGGVRNYRNQRQLHRMRSLLGGRRKGEVMELEQMQIDLGMWVTPQPEEAKQKISELPDNIRIRKLTPKECYRLMAFSDEDYANAEAVNSNTQLYKQAGNSICVNVLEAIFGQMFVGKENHWKRWLEEKCYEDNH